MTRGPLRPDEPMKRLDEIGLWNFSKRHSLVSNVEYWSRRFYRKAQDCRRKKAAAGDVRVAIFYGVSAAHLFQKARMLHAIAVELKKNNGIRENISQEKCLVQTWEEKCTQQSHSSRTGKMASSAESIRGDSITDSREDSDDSKTEENETRQMGEK